MKINQLGDHTIQFEEVFNPISLKTKDGEEISICMRDSGFEFKYGSKFYSAQKGVLKELKPVCPICDSGHKSKKVFVIPLQDKNGFLNYNKWLRVTEGSKLYYKLLNGGFELPRFLIIK